MTMNFGPDMAPAGTVDSGAAAAPAKTKTTEAQLGDLLTERQKLAAQMIDLSKNGQFGDVLVDDGAGGYMSVPSGDSQKLTGLAKTFDSLGDLARYGSGSVDALDKTGGAGGLSANTMAQIAQQDRQLQESMRQFDITTAQSNAQHADTLAFNREQLGANVNESQQNRAETQRQNNLSSTLDLLTNQIKVGELGVNEASNRITAAAQAAGIQRDILANHAGKALPAGTKTYPNLGAGGPIAAAAQALGMPFKPFETLGTFAIDPNAIAAPISSAAGQSVVPGVNDQVAAAAQALAGMGVPHMASGGLVQGAYVSGENGPEINIPMRDGHSFVIPNNALGGASPPAAPQASIPQGEIPGQGYSWNGQQPTGGAWTGWRPGMMAPAPRMGDQPGFMDWYNSQVAQKAGGWLGRIGGLGAQLGTAPGVTPELLMRVQQMLSGVGRGIPPSTPGGAQVHPPQVGPQGLAQSMGGG